MGFQINGVEYIDNNGHFVNSLLLKSLGENIGRSQVLTFHLAMCVIAKKLVLNFTGSVKMTQI